jgi:hypothetical protein
VADAENTRHAWISNISSFEGNAEPLALEGHLVTSNQLSAHSTMQAIASRCQRIMDNDRKSKKVTSFNFLELELLPLTIAEKVSQSRDIFETMTR